MFSLIITIISIALVAALALATLYYGGSAFNKGSAGAEASKLINEGQQVNGANAIYNAESGSVTTPITTVTGLVTGTYLAQVPASFAGDAVLADGYVSKVIADGKICTEVNKRAGVDAGATPPVVAPGTLGDVVASNFVFGCTLDNNFFYKL